MAVNAKPKSHHETKESQNGLVVKDAKRQSYLITFYTPSQGEPVVLLQASHSLQVLRFPNLESTFEFLERQAHKDKQLEEP